MKISTIPLQQWLFKITTEFSDFKGVNETREDTEIALNAVCYAMVLRLILLQRHWR
jgi:hypothetical protein